MHVESIQNELVNTYEDLILERDELECECDALEVLYQKEFGQEIINIFKEEVECIKLKKIITMLQIKINKEEKVNLLEIDNKIISEMNYYQQLINQKIEHFEGCNASKRISDSEAREVKKLYREIAKVIHPDSGIQIIDNDLEIKNIWDKVYISYRKNDLKGIREASVLLNKLLKNIDKTQLIICYDRDITELIEELNDEISDIKNNIPYTYSEWIYDEEEVVKKHEENLKMFDSYKDYKIRLNDMIDLLKKEAIKNE